MDELNREVTEQTAPINDHLTHLVEEMQAHGITIEEAAKTFDDAYVHAALLACKGNVTRAARRIGLHRNSVHNRLRGERFL